MYKPKISEEAGEYLVREYVDMRKLGASRGQVSSCCFLVSMLEFNICSTRYVRIILLHTLCCTIPIPSFVKFINLAWL